MIGKILKTMRHESGLTQKDTSEKTYIGRSTLSDFEREKTDISFENIEKIANVCNYNIIFVNKKDKNKLLSSDNIDRKEI